MDNRELIKRVLESDDQAFSVLIERYKNLVYTTTYRIVRNKSDAEDLFQDVFLEAYRSLYHVRNEEDLSGWLFRIAHNKSISFLRKKNPAKANREKDGITPLELAQKDLNFADKETPGYKYEQQEASKILFMAIENLPEMQKKVLLMHKFEDYSHQEIGEELNLSRSSVESLIYRAKYSLRKSLYGYFKKI